MPGLLSRVAATRWIGGLLLLVCALLLMLFYIPVKQWLYRIGVPSELTPIPALGGLFVCLGCGIWLIRRSEQ
jgi:hypothetical protein